MLFLLLCNLSSSIRFRNRIKIFEMEANFLDITLILVIITFHIYKGNFHI